LCRDKIAYKLRQVLPSASQAGWIMKNSFAPFSPSYRARNGVRFVFANGGLDA